MACTLFYLSLYAFHATSFDTHSKSETAALGTYYYGYGDEAPKVEPNAPRRFAVPFFLQITQCQIPTDFLATSYKFVQ